MTAIRLFGPEVLGSGVASHTGLPTPLVLEDRLRIFVGARDAEGRTHMHYVDVARDQLTRVLATGGPLISLGNAGHFDEDGTTPSSVVQLSDGRIRLYYIGWNRAAGSVSYRLAIGSAISDDGATFRREFDGPVLDRSIHDPILVTAPHVTMHDSGSFEMFYVSGTRWVEVDGHAEPCYGLARALSEDGIDWDPLGFEDVRLRTEALGRPTLFVHGGRRFIACSHRGSVGYRTGGPHAYRLTFLESRKGSWYPVASDFAPAGDEAWCSAMRCYGHLVDVDQSRVLLYNGDGFGASGVIAAPCDVIAG